MNHSINGSSTLFQSTVIASATFPPNSRNVAINGAKYCSVKVENCVDRFCNTGRK